jgi:replicative DNA helicase
MTEEADGTESFQPVSHRDSMAESMRVLEAQAQSGGFQGDVLQLERKVLASVFLAPEKFEIFRNVSTWFDDHRHKTIWNAMAEARVQHDRIDMRTVVERLECWNYLEVDAGGLAYIAALPDALASAEDVSSVLAEWKLRG